MTYFAAAAGIISAVAQAAPRAQAAPPRREPVRIEVDANKRANFRIPRTVFGTFLEPIGNSTYNGLWAEILENPSFEENLWSASRIAQMIREEPALARASQLALPLPWEPVNPAEGNRYEPRWGDVANSSRALAIFGVPDQATGVKQKVYLPVHRERKYEGGLYVKHVSGPPELTVAIRHRGGDGAVLSEAKIAASDAEWHKYSFSLVVPEGKLASLEAADFAVEVTGDARVLIDQASLMPADAIDGMDPDIIEMSKDMHTPLVRFGGNFTSGYHWRDGIGPRDKRVSMLNIAWGMPEYNQFGTDEFLRYCQLIGAEPQIALNLGSGTAQEAAEWVKYVDERWPTHGGLLWELGNELWGNWNLAYPTLKELPGRTREYSEAVRAVDPKARLIATGQDPDHFEEWNAAQMTNPHGTFDFLSTHFVVTTDRLQDASASPETVALDSFALPVGLGRRLREMQKQIQGSPAYRDTAKIAFTEWLWVCCGNREVATAPRYENMGGAVTTAGFLNMLLENADIVPVSDMTGIIEFAGIWKKHGRVFGTPAYYAFQMYAGADIDTPVAASSSAGSYNVQRGVTRLPEIPHVPYLDVVAALNKSGDRLTVFCVNRNLEKAVDASLRLKGFAASGKAQVESLGADSIYDVNDEESPEAITPAHATVPVSANALAYTFPAASVTRIELRAR